MYYFLRVVCWYRKMYNYIFPILRKIFPKVIRVNKHHRGYCIRFLFPEFFAQVEAWVAIASAIVSISVSILPNERLVQICFFAGGADSISIHEIPRSSFHVRSPTTVIFLRTHAPESCVKSYAVFTPCFSSFAACLRPIPPHHRYSSVVEL